MICPLRTYSLSIFLSILIAPNLLFAQSGGVPPVSFLNGQRSSPGGVSDYSAVSADLNGDGKPDLVVANYCQSRASCTRGSVGVLLGNGDGTFQSTVTYDSGGYGPTFVTVADVNGDGRADVIVVNQCVRYKNGCSGTGLIGLLLGNGDGTFRPVVTYGSGGNGPLSVAASDLNHDGKLDLVVANECAPTCGSGQGEVGVLLGNGDGTFQSAVLYQTGGDGPQSVALGDLNNDQVPDIVVANSCVTNANCSQGGSVAVLLGNGDGTFQSAVTYPSGGLFTSSVVVADINGDGVPDLLTRNRCSRAACNAGGSIGLLLGNGNGTFNAVVSYTSGGLGADPVGVADLNGDGKPDPGIANMPSTSTAAKGAVEISRGNGDGTFQGGNVSGPASAVAGHVATFSNRSGKNIADGGALATVATTGNYTDLSDKPTIVSSVSGTTGRITSTAGTAPQIDLATSGVTAGSCGDSTHSCSMTLDAYGRVTSMSNTAIAAGGTVSSASTNQIALSRSNGTTVAGGTATLDSSGNLSINSVTTCLDNGAFYVGGGCASFWGGGDIGAQINKAYAACPAKGCAIVILPNGSTGIYNFTTPIVMATAFKPASLLGWVAGPASNVQLNYTPTSGTAVTLDYVAGDGLKPFVAMSDITLINRGCISFSCVTGTAIGMVHGATNFGAPKGKFENVNVSGFPTGVSVPSQWSWGEMWDNCSFTGNGTGYTNRTNNEAMVFHSCTFTDNGTAIALGSGDLYLINGSVDQSNNFGVSVAGGQFYGTDVHWESTGASTTKAPRFVNATGGNVHIKGGVAVDAAYSGTGDYWFQCNGCLSFDIDSLQIQSLGRQTTTVFNNAATGRARVSFISHYSGTRTAGANNFFTSEFSYPDYSGNTPYLFRQEAPFFGIWNVFGVLSGIDTTDSALNLGRGFSGVNPAYDAHIADIGSGGDCTTSSTKGDLCVRADGASNHVLLSVAGNTVLDVGPSGVSINGGTNNVYRCVTAGILPVGSLTSNSAACGSTADTWLRVP